MVWQLPAVGAEVDTGQDQFFEPRLCQPPGFFDDGIGLA